jgi:tryptophan synthase beta subunit
MSICLSRHSELQLLLVSCACASELIAETAIAQQAPVASSASRSRFFMAISVIMGFPLIGRAAMEVGRAFQGKYSG